MNKTTITGSMKMSDVIASDQRTIVLMPRFGIQLGFGDKTVKQICLEQSIQQDFFLLMVNTFLSPNYFPGRKLKNVDAKLLLLYLENSHDYYIREKIPHLQSLVERYLKDLPRLAKSQLEEFFKGYIQEVLVHIAYEEQVVFPYINDLIEFVENHAKGKPPSGYSIKEFSEKHDDIEEKLSDLKSLLIKYFPHDTNRYLRILILNELIDLEQDLVNHARLEDKVLIPIVGELERLNTGRADKNVQNRILNTLNTYMLGNQHETNETDNQLSAREIDVLKLLVKGLSNKEVANKLFISTHTVMSHRKNISRKLAIKSVAGLTVYAILNGIIDMDDLK